MGRGSYLGGSTIVGEKGIQSSPRSNRYGRITSTGPELERRKLAKREQEKQARARIKANEKLIRKLAKEWRERGGKRVFKKLTADREAKANVTVAHGSGVPSAGTFAEALRAAFSRRNSGKR